MSLERGRRTQEVGVGTQIEPLDWFWVKGLKGAVTTWFSHRTKDVIGYSVCDGAVFHSPRPRDGYHFETANAVCEFLGRPCWFARGSAIEAVGPDKIPTRAYDSDDIEGVYLWLENHYSEAFEGE